MKLKVEYDATLAEPSVTIRAAKDSPELAALLHRLQLQAATLAVWAGSQERFLPTSEILFVETAARSLQVHTRRELFTVKRTLQAVADDLPENFQQIAKSTIVNLNQVSGVERAIANCAVSFYDSYKQVYASRRYYKSLVTRLAEMRAPS